MTRRLGAEQQDAGRVAKLDRLGDDLQSLGEELAALLPGLAHMQRPDRLHDRVGERGDRPAHGEALQRAKNETPTPRAPPSSISASSPQSISPPRSARTWLSRPASARPEMRSA